MMETHKKACGFALLSAGFKLFTDSNRILLSRVIAANSETLSSLQHPFFYYIALGLAGAGLIAIFISLIGWWAITCLSNYFVLSIYFLIVLCWLLVEFSFCSMAAVWPQCIGLSLDESLMVKMLQSSYGVPGKEQLTASIDLVQTHFKCCAISSNLDYDMSLWKLQNYAKRDWVVPATCCILQNSHEKRSYLDPKPLNISLCQSLLKHEYNHARYSQSCLEHLSTWYEHHTKLFLIGGLVLAAVQMMVLISIIFTCTRMASSHRRKTLI
ncbi:tetraspanin-11 isoform X2 [Sitodiplosis mosellana]|uniref:tetraspanin-11 isoform X2 n=1 Tax=Sitodiplosis mosellana TaxID=263140 RepID=UPI0024444556|nr:tetraspanin-11 isoform X2 [Sitodiplosis mosellana]